MEGLVPPELGAQVQPCCGVTEHEDAPGSIPLLFHEQQSYQGWEVAAPSSRAGV